MSSNTHPLKVAITGAINPGIGKAIVEKMAKHESFCSIALIAKQKDEHTDLFIQECRTNCDTEVRFIETDITNPEAIKASTDKAASIFSGLDIGVHAASVLLPTDATKEDLVKRYELSNKIHTVATLAFAHALFPHLCKSSDPRFLNISPPMGFEAKTYSGNIAYVATQYTRSMLSVALAHDTEWQKYNIMVNNLWPLRRSSDNNVFIYQPHMERQQRDGGLEVVAQAAVELLTAHRVKFTPNGECLYDEELLELLGIPGIGCQDPSWMNQPPRQSQSYQQPQRTRPMHPGNQRSQQPISNTFRNNVYEDYDSIA